MLGELQFLCLHPLLDFTWQRAYKMYLTKKAVASPKILCQSIGRLYAKCFWDASTAFFLVLALYRSIVIKYAESITTVGSKKARSYLEGFNSDTRYTTRF